MKNSDKPVTEAEYASCPNGCPRPKTRTGITVVITTIPAKMCRLVCSTCGMFGPIAKWGGRPWFSLRRRKDAARFAEAAWNDMVHAGIEGEYAGDGALSKNKRPTPTENIHAP